MFTRSFFRDSRYDHIASRRAGLDFLFVSGWSDLENWEDYVSDHDLQSICFLADLLDSV